jgi:hypothetical protein
MFYLILYFILLFYSFYLSNTRGETNDVVPLPSCKERLDIVNDLIRSDFSFPAYASDKKQSFAGILHGNEKYFKRIIILRFANNSSR